MATKSILPEPVSAQFKLKKDAPLKIYDPKVGDIDFRVITIDQAQALVMAGNPYIEKTKNTITEPTV
ncbi:hypothetical protein [Pedobacter sp.]|uniref:hypothetical protein n=1 Tax=Pedobacter sp. TaxID=1411316 RepID=UPI0031D63619